MKNTILQKYAISYIPLLRQRIVILFFIFFVFIVHGFAVAQESEERTDFLYGERLYKENLFDLAVLQFKNFVKNHPESPSVEKAHYYMAESFFSLERFGEAQEEYLQCIVRYPNSTFEDQAQFRIGQCFEKQNKMKDAVESYLRLSGLYPKSLHKKEALYRSGTLSMEMGHQNKAESILRTLLELSEEGAYRSKTMFLLSQLYVEKGEYEKGIELLKTLSNHPVQEDDRAEAAFRLGLINETMGYFKESQNHLQAVLTSTKNEELKQKAQFHLGMQFRLEGKNSRALDAFHETALLGSDTRLKTNAWFLQGQILHEQGEYRAAVHAFEEASAGNDPFHTLFRSQYEKAVCLEALGERTEAIIQLEKITQDSVPESSVLKKSLLKLAHIHRQQNNFPKAIAYYNRYMTQFQEDPLEDCILLQKGKICLQDMELWAEGFLALQSIWSQFPGSALVPEARYVSGQHLERLERTEEAEQMYRILSVHYSASPWNQKALNHNKKVRPVNWNKAFSELTLLVQQFISGKSNPDLLYNLGYLSFKDLSQYRNAVHYFLQYLREHPEGSRREETLFYLAQCYTALYDQSLNEAYLDSASSMYETVLSEYPQSSFNAESALNVIQLHPEESPLLVIEKYRHYLERYPDSSHRGEVLFQLGKINQERDSLHQALIQFSDLQLQYPLSGAAEEALLHIGSINARLGKIDEADSIFAKYIELYPNGRYTPESLFHRAGIAERKKQWTLALAFYEKIDHRFNFSVWADSVRIPMGNMYLKNLDYKNAIDFFQSALQEDSLVQWAATVGLRPAKPSIRKDCLYGLAKGYEGFRQFQKAKALYLQYGREYSGPADQVRFLQALAFLAESEGKSVRAVEYLNQIVQMAPVDSTAEALAMLYFRLDDYVNAVPAFEKAVSLTTGKEKQADFSSRIIVSLLRQGKIPQAEVRIDLFNRSFKENPGFEEYQAEFFYEKGVAYISKKDFEPALESLERILQKYKKSPYVPQAELEIGRTYLITNKIEDALGLLTSMVNRYTGQPILAKVYLNLGDFYFRSQQYENAMRAFKLAMEEKRMPDVIPTAMRYLIRVYNTLSLWDAALGLTRTYIREYPDSEDVLQKRVDIGIFYMELSEYGRAAEYLRGVKQDADSETEAQIQYWIGKCYYNMGQFEQAVFELLKVNYLSKPTKLPWATTAMYEAGLAYLKLDNPVQARGLFEKIVQKEGATSDLGRIARQRIEEIDSGAHTH